MANKPKRGVRPQAKSSLAPPSLRNGSQVRATQTRRKSRFEQLEDRRLLTVQPFTPGDLAVVRMGDGVGSLTSAGSTVWIDEYSPTGTLVQSIEMPTTDTTTAGVTQHAFVNSGSASSEGQLNLSTDGQYLTLVGYDATVGTAGLSGTSSATVPRTVGVMSYTGSIDTTTALTNFANANNPRGAVSTDGQNIWLAGADSATGGIEYISHTGNSVTTVTANLTGSTLKNARDVEIFNGQLYIASDKTSSIIATLGTGLPNGDPGEPGGATPPITGLAGTALVPGSASATNSFFFARLGTGANVNGYDTLYVADGSGTATNATPGITKYTYNGSSWVSNGSIGGLTAFEGLTGSVSSGTVQLYVTSPNHIDSIADSSGFNGSLTATVTSIATADANESFRGIAFAPQAAAVHFVVTATPSSVVAGAAFSLTVTAEDASNAVLTGYRGTVQFSSTDTNANIVLPGNYAFTAGDNGTHTFNNIKLDTAGSQSVTATDQATDGSGIGNVTVTAGTLSQLSVSAPVDAVSGSAFSVTVTAQDQYGNTVSGYTGTVQLSGSAGATFPGSHTFVSGDNGSFTFTNDVTLTGTGTKTITATDSGNSVNGSTTVADYVVSAFTPGNIVVYRVGIGGSNNLTGAASAVFLDEYTPSGSFVQTVPMPVVSTGGGNQALVAAGNAISEGELTLSPNGQYLTVTGYDAPIGTGVVSNTSSTAVPRTIAVVTPSGSVNSTTALTDFSPNNNVRSAVTTDGTSLWVVGGAGGVGYTTVGSTTSTDIDPTGEQNLRDIQIVNGQIYVSSQKTVTVATVGTGTPTAPSQTLASLSGVAGNMETPNAFFLTQLNPASGGVDTLYVADTIGVNGNGQGDIEKYSLDPDGVDWDFVNVINAPGVTGLTGSVSGTTVTLYGTTSGSQNETGTLYKVTDSSGLFGTPPSTATSIVTAATNEAFRGVALVPQTPSSTATHFLVSTTPSVTAGSPFNVTVTAEDASNNPVTNFTGTVTFSTTDMNGNRVLPADYPFTMADGGSHTFTAGATLFTAGTQTITVGGTIFGTSSNITVNPAAASSFVVTGPSDSTAGIAFSVTVAVQDQYGNPVTNYTGTVHFSGSAGATFPANYPFVSGDNGTHTFTNGVTLTSGSATGSNQTITATDTVHSGVTGSTTVDDFVVSPFTAGDLVVYRTGLGVNALDGSATEVFLDEYSPTGTLVESVPLPVTSNTGGNQALLASGSATSEGQLSLSGNGGYLVLAGYDSTVGTASISGTASTAVPRTIGVVGVSGSVNTTTALTDFSTGNNVRGATSTDGTNLWIAGAVGGVAYTTVGSTTSTGLDPAGDQNTRNLEVINGQLYVSSQKSSINLATVGTGTPTTSPQTLTNLPGLPTDNIGANGYFLTHLNGAGTAPDTLYITDTVSNAAAGQIDKYSLVSGSWVATGSIAVGTGVSGLTGVVNGGTVTLYATSSGTLGTAGTLYKAMDSTGYNGTASGSASSVVTAAGNEAFRGVTFAPTTPSAPNPPHVATSGSTGQTFTVSVPANAAVAVDSGLTLTSSDANIDSAKMVITNFQSGDQLNFTNQNGISGSYSSGTLTLTGSSAHSNYQTALDSVTFSTTSTTTTTRTVAVTASDSAASPHTGNTVTDTVQVAVGAPTVTNGGQASKNATAGQTVVVDSLVTVQSADTNMTGAVVTIGTNRQAGDSLNFTAQNGITIVSNTNGTLTLTGTTSKANYQTALDSITFSSTSTSTLTRTVSFVVQDSADTGNVASSAANTNLVISAPVRISGLYVKGSAWTAAFNTYIGANSLGSSTLGYLLKTGAAQSTALPFNNINTIDIQFSGPVSGITTGSLKLVGGTGGGATGAATPAPTITAVSSLGGNAYQVSLSGPLTNNKYVFAVASSNSSFSPAVLDGNLAGIDGEFTTGTSTFATDGNGLAGGTFDFFFNVLPGDGNLNALVNVADRSGAAALANKRTTTAGYNPYFDYNGAGLINTVDTSLDAKDVNDRQTSISAPTAPTASQGGGIGMTGLALGVQETGSSTSSSPTSTVSNVVSASPSTSSSTTSTSTSSTDTGSGSTTTSYRDHGRHHLAATDAAVSQFDVVDLWA